MFRKRSFLIVVAAAVAIASASLAGATSGTGALENSIGGMAKVRYTGYTSPTNHYSLIDRLQLPVGSWLVTAHTVLQESGGAPATTAECYLVAPNATDSFAPEGLSPVKGASIRAADMVTVSNAPNGGNADLLCRVNTRGAGQLVTARNSTIVAVSAAGATVTHNPPPPFGSY